jgi:uncharacterized protein YjiS (DUF1127 family)
MSTAAYPVLPIAAGTLARVVVAILAPAVMSSKALSRAMRHRRQANVLAHFDRHMLADIGLTHSDVRDAFATPLWQDPTVLLCERANERRTGRGLMRTTRWVGGDSAFKRPATDRPSRQAI